MAKLGAPFKYTDEELIEKVQQLQREEPTITIAGLCARLGTHNDYLWERKRKCPALSDALKKCEMIRQDAWIEMMRTNITNREFVTPAWIFAMKNITKWRDRSKEDYEDEAEAHVKANEARLTKEERVKEMLAAQEEKKKLDAN